MGRFERLLVGCIALLVCFVFTPVCQAAGDAWATKAPMPCGVGIGSANAVDGRIYCFGGMDSSFGCSTDSLWVYEPTLDSWTLASGAYWRMRFASCVLDGKIYSFGGTSDGHTAMNNAHSYEPATDTWAVLAEMPVRIAALRAAPVNGKIYLIGGYDKTQGATYSTVFEYDPVEDSYTEKAQMPTPRANHEAVVVHGRIYVFGGYAVTPAILDTVEVYDPVSDTWATRTPMLNPSYDFGAEAVNGLIYLFGGSNPSATGNTSYVSIYDPAHDSWSEGTPLPTKSRSAIMTSAVNGRIYVCGGWAADGWNENLLGSSLVEEYTPAGWPFEATAVSPRGKLPTAWAAVKASS